MNYINFNININIIYINLIWEDCIINLIWEDWTKFDLGRLDKVISI